MKKRKEQVQNGNNDLWQYFFMSAGIPSDYHSIKYSKELKKLQLNYQEHVKDFLNKRNHGIFFITDDNSIPYVVFRRMMTINIWFYQSRILNAYKIQEDGKKYNWEKLFGVFRVDTKATYGRTRLMTEIMNAYENDAFVMITTAQTDSAKLSEYFEPIWDVFEKSFLVVRC